MKISERQSQALWNLKGFAVIAIVACHCCHVSENASWLNNIAVQFFDYWISFGVPIFCFVAGYFFKKGKNITSFLLKKVKTIIIPWIFTGTIVWLYIVLRKGGIGLENWFNYLFMKESYLYFLNDLLLFYLLFYAILGRPKRIKICNYLMAFIIAMAEIFEVTVLLNYSPGNGLPVANLLMFYMGIVFRERNILRFFEKSFYSYLVVGFVLLRYIEFYYSVEYNLLIKTVEGLILVIGLYSFCFWMTKKHIACLKVIGKYSFAIYLLHMPAAGLISNILNRSESFAILTFFRPIIVVLITFGLIKVYEIITMDRKNLRILVGLR